MRTLTEIKVDVDNLAGVIGASNDALPTYGSSADFGHSHIEVINCEYHYVAVEHGQELSRVTTADFDDLLFQIFHDVTFHLAIEFELEYRIEQQDCRRIIFDRQIQLLSMLSSAWANRQAAAHLKILDTYPFDDFAGYYASRIAGYTQAGFSYGTARKLAAIVTKKAKLSALFKRFIKRTTA